MEPIITIGHDAELFLRQLGTKKFFPGIGIIGGSKAFPKPVKDGALQEDNVMAELNIIPATTSDEFVSRTKSVLSQLKDIIKEHNLYLSPVAHAKFEKFYLEHWQAKEFGCEPDFNIYTYMENRVDREPLEREGIRVAGGHIHIGIVNEFGQFLMENNPDARLTMARACDMYISILSVLLDTDKVRKNFYGKAGSIRFKPYGIEYRTPSNFWIKNPLLMGWIFDRAKLAAVMSMEDAGWVNRYATENGDVLQTCIDTGDTRIGKALGGDLFSKEEIDYVRDVLVPSVEDI